MFKKDQIDMRSSGVLAELEERRRRKEEWLENSRLEHRTIPREEILGVCAVHRTLADFLDRYGESTDPEHLKALVSYLDTLPLWKAKFSTGEYDREHRLVIDDVMDSLYYLTPSGLSLRLKRSLLVDGEKMGEGSDMRAVIQSFADLILFRRKEEGREAFLSYWDDFPITGSPVTEYFSWTLEEVLNQPSSQVHAFESPVAVRRDEFGIKSVDCEAKFRAGTHEGHDVNKIYFVR